MTANRILSVIIAARNEESYIVSCLSALLSQDDAAGAVKVIVAANACTDETVMVARSMADQFTARGWELTILDLADGGKVGALNAAEAVAQSDMRIYLDADVICAPALLGQLRSVLDTASPIYATGTLQVAPAQTWVTRAYARVWTQLPFVKGGAVGAGLFAVNGAARARWGDFPNIISDDTFVRMHFDPSERVEVPATYIWPMIEGFRSLVRVRRRQDTGVAEIHQLYPEIVGNEGKGRVGIADMTVLLITAPLGFAVYLAVHLAVRLRPSTTEWTRGR